jgi:hypothetical protein
MLIFVHFRTSERSHRQQRGRTLSIFAQRKLESEYRPEVASHVDGKRPSAVAQAARHVEPQQVEKSQRSDSE